ncbi:hypothetical protein AMST5_04176 [freshwater sediment metagenome]|uniref:Uncharacterized protein n=1 Tax=freshwater sediment metagenome TaxID=556182 RepID=A0AA48M6J8_9ZZZZ
MPKAFAILINVIIGYLDGAGLGALSLELLPDPWDSQAHAALLALLMIGPLGALFGLAIAVGQGEAKKAQGA